MEFRAVIFDWAGTLIDFGSVAPAEAFVRAFATFDVDVSLAEARGPMGLPKRDHIAAMFGMAPVAERWAARHGNSPEQRDIDAVYKAFLPLTVGAVVGRARLIPGALEAIEDLRGMGLKIGSTTGYTRSIMEHVLPRVAAQGFAPDALVCSDDLLEGRPGPLGIYKCMVDMAVYPPERLIKVDDTAPGIMEGRAAGCVTVGVALSGNAVGMTEETFAALSPEEVADLRAAAEAELKGAGADHVIDCVADLPALVRALSGA